MPGVNPLSDMSVVPVVPDIVSITVEFELKSSREKVIFAVFFGGFVK